MNIKNLRKELGLSQVKFAELLGTTQITVSAWENGKCPAYIEKLAELALTYDCRLHFPPDDECLD